MYESSAEYVVGGRPKVRNTSRAAAGTNTMQSIRALVGQRKWQVVIGVCLVMSVVAVAFPATVGHSMKQTAHRRAVTRAVYTVAQNEPAEEPREVFNAPMVDKKALAAHRRPTKAKTRKATTKKRKHPPPPPRKKPPKATTKKHKRPSPPPRKPPKMAEEKEPEAPEKDAPQKDLPAQDAPASSVVDASRPSVDSTTEKMTSKPVETAKMAAHKQEGSQPGNESIFRFSTVPLINDSASGDHNVEDIRLPRTVKPLAYKLVLTPIYGEQSMSFKGNVRITLEALAPTKLIQLHSANLVINRANLSLNFVSTAPGPDILSIRTNDYSQFLYINLAEDLLTGDKYELHIPFTTGALYDNGFNVRRYQRENGPPVYVRRVFTFQRNSNQITSEDLSHVVEKAELQGPRQARDNCCQGSETRAYDRPCTLISADGNAKQR
ncbi:hypothetical protein V5799_023516 [Amblyomma americanum]|uniref:Aminopeptidase N-like N-terminal domain-containing protein n=1 Tax=Amblyomma americanum TaxID=6943 RepID=A0AAQ4FJ19_AMBAM